MYTSLVKISDNLSDGQHEDISRQMLNKKIDGLELSTAGGRWGAIWEEGKDYDLSFLRFYKGIKTLIVNLKSTADVSSITTLSNSLEYLHLGEFNNKKISFDFLGQMKELKLLSVVRQPNGLESILKLKNLINLNLTGYNIEKLEYINELKNLKSLYIGFGTSTSLKTIDKLNTIDELSILWVKKLNDITAISKLENLVKLKIEDEKQIKELPDLQNLKKLKNIRLMNLNGLENISSLRNSFVEEFIITGRNTNAEVVSPISLSSSVKKAYTYFYTGKVQKQAEQILGTKFCKLNSMEYEMDNKASRQYFDLKTWRKIE